jgi:hypothetical protein
VTEIIDAVLAKNGLPDWYYKQAIAGMSILIKKYDHVLPNDIKSLHSLMKTEGLSPYAIRDEAASIGTKIHTSVEALAKGRRPKDYPVLTEWWKARGFRASHILAAEGLLYSGRWNYAGTVDLIYRDPETEQVVLADIKTGALRDSHHVQLELYRWAWEEMGGTAIDMMELIRVPRDGSDVQTEEVKISSTLSRAAEGLLEAYSWLKG